MEENERIKQLVDKILAGSASAEEEKEVQEHFEGSAQAETVWDESVIGNKADAKAALVQKISFHLKESRPKQSRRLWPFIRIAASMLLFCAVGWWIFEGRTVDRSPGELAEAVIAPASEKGSLRLSSGDSIDLEGIGQGQQVQKGNVRISRNEEGELLYSFLQQPGSASSALPNVLTTPRGGRLTLVLPDGTKVWMNSQSSLEFPAEFTGDSREVHISGEAYFDVAKNPERPFVVTTDQSRIQVLGTQFNVNAYRDEHQNVIALVEGSIELHVDDARGRLRPGEQAVVAPGEALRLERADLETITAWKDNNFVFKNQNIKTIMNEISRWYDVEVEYQGNMQDKYFDIFISRRENINEILSLIQVTESVHFKVEGRRVIVIE